MVVRNLPANTSHLRGSSSKSNCKRDEIPFIVLGWMQWAGAPEGALALPRNVPADGPLPCSQCHLGAQAMSPAWGGWREMAQKLSQKDCFLERVLCWKEALPGPASSSPGLQNSMGILPAWLRLAGSFPGMAGASPAAAALTLPQLSSCTAKKEHPTKPTLNESPVLLGSTDTRGGSPGLPRASSTCPWRAGGPFVPPRAHILRPLVPV